MPSVSSTHMSRVATDKKVRPAQPASKRSATTFAANVADKPLGWFDRLKRLFKRKAILGDSPDDDPIEHIAAIKRQAATKATATAEAVDLRMALKLVLDRHASSRSVLVHLAVLENALSRHGMKALDELPPDVMRRALSQLETLVSDWSQGGLAALRARITSALVKHKRRDIRRSTTKRLSDFEDSDRLQVDEATVSTFMEANARWQRSP
jgi:hypothetical protein